MVKLNNSLIEIFKKNLTGGVVTTGNTCAVIGDINSKISNFIKPDGTYTTNWAEMGSTGYLDIPNNSSVKYAVLEWHSVVASNGSNGVEITESYTPISFTTPEKITPVFINQIDDTEAFYTDIYNNKISVKWTEVTSLVESSKSGLYTVLGIPTAPLGSEVNTNIAPGWSLTVAYQNNDLTNKNITIYMGLKQFIYTKSKLENSFTINNLSVPNISKKSYLTIVSSNGDPNYYSSLNLYNDISLINSTDIKYSVGNKIDSTYDDPKSGIIVPYDNMFSGIIMNTNTESPSYGQLETRGTLGDKNNYAFNAITQSNFKGNRGKLDILSFDISDKILQNQNKLILSVDFTKIPPATPQIISSIMQIETGQTFPKPTITLNKSINKNFASLQDEIQYTIEISNLAGQDAKGLIIFDAIPPNASLVKDSLTINGVVKLGSVLPISGIALGDLSLSSQILVTYKIMFYENAVQSQVKIEPKLTYNYLINQTDYSMEAIIGTCSNLTFVRSPIDSVILYSSKDTALKGDKIKYTVILNNVTQSTAKNLKIKNIIPSGLRYEEGSLTLNGLSINGDLNSGILIESLPTDKNSTITFNVIVL